MQTFLPYESFRESAKVLDWRRLGKQRVEGMQIINAIEGKKRKDGKPYKGTKNLELLEDGRFSDFYDHSYYISTSPRYT